MKKLIENLIQKTKLILVYKICKFTDQELLDLAFEHKKDDSKFVQEILDKAIEQKAEDQKFIKRNADKLIEQYEKIEKKALSEDDYKARLMFLAFQRGEGFERFCENRGLKPSILFKYKEFKATSRSSEELNKHFDLLRKEYERKINYQMDKKIMNEKNQQDFLKKRNESLVESLSKLQDNTATFPMPKEMSVTEMAQAVESSEGFEKLQKEWENRAIGFNGFLERANWVETSNSNDIKK